MKYVVYAIIIILVLYIMLTVIYKIHASKKAGNIGEKITADALKVFRKKYRKCKVINGIYLPLYNESCEIDHIVFADFGVVVIETKNVHGTIKGDINDTNLTHIVGNKKNKLYNPLLQNKTHCDNVAHHLRKSGFGNVPVYSMVVFTADDLQYPKGLGIRPNHLSKALLSFKKNKFDYKQMYAVIKDIRIKSPLKKLMHDAKKH